MYPVEPPDSFVGQRIDYGPPKGVPEEDCGRLVTVCGEVNGGSMDGVHTLTSFWRLTEEEIEKVIKSGTVKLTLLATIQPPVIVEIHP